MKKSALFFAFTLLILAPFRLQAQASANLSVRDFETLYRSIETLAGFGLVPSATYGHRPWSANEVHTYLKQARTLLPELCQKNPKIQNCAALQTQLQNRIEHIQTQIDRYRSMPGKTVQARLHELQFQVSILDSPPTALKANNGIGRIKANVNPLTDNFEGQHFVDGGEYNWDLSSSLQITPYFYNFRETRFENLFPKTGKDQTRLIPHKLYGKFQYRNVQMLVGRDSLAWGQSEYGGILLSANARPLDMIFLGNDSPFLLPGFLKIFGPWNVSALFANTGPESEYPYGFLAAYKITMKPASIFEFSLSNLVRLGGEGAPDQVGVFKVLGDLSGFSSTQNGRSNRILGFDGALTLPGLRYTRLYGETFFDDRYTKHFEDTYLHAMSYTAGVYIPRLNQSGTLQLRAEGVLTGSFFYRHSQYRDGMTLNGLILGDPLGPDSFRSLIKVYWETSPTLAMDFSTTFEGRDSNTYDFLEDGIEKVQDNPTEDRLRQALHINKKWSKTITSDFHLGYEHVWNSQFVQDQAANHFFLLALTSFHFD